LPPLSPSHASIRFGDFDVDLRAGELRKHGIRIKLQVQPFQILQVLLEHPGEVVSREELQKRVWPADTFVDFDHGLNNAVKRLREALGEDAENPRFIETLSKRGYRFIGSVSRSSDAEGLVERPSFTIHPSNRKLQIGVVIAIGAAVLLVVLVILRFGKLWPRGSASASPLQIHSLAVLPFQNLSGDSTQEYFSDGMTDALITDLAQIGSLKVISRTSSMQYKQTKKSLPEIAREMNVDGIVEGTVQRSGDRVRITTQLIHGPSDKHVWANSYERDTRDVFALERDITEDVARQIRARITPENQATLARPRAVNPNVLEAYLQGNYYLSRYGKGSGDEARRKASEYFQQAIDADPNFAPAFKGLADSHSNLSMPSNQDAAIVIKATKHALELDPDFAEALVILAEIKFFHDWDFRGGEEEVRRALAISPNNAEVHTELCAFLYFLGRRDEALRECNISQQLDPTGDHARDVDALYWAGEDDRAISLAQMLLQTDPDDGYLHHALYRYYSRKGLYKEAGQEAGRALALFGDPDGAVRVHHALVASGGRAALRQFAREMEDLIRTKQGYFPGNVAAAYAVLDNKDRAFYWLEDAYKHHDLAWLATDIPLESLESERMFDSLRSDPRYKDLTRRIGLPQ